MFSLKMNEMSLSIQEKQDRNHCFAKDNILAVKQKLKLWKIYVMVSLKASNASMSFLMSVVVILMKMTSKYNKMKFVNNGEN